MELAVRINVIRSKVKSNKQLNKTVHIKSYRPKRALINILVKMNKNAFDVEKLKGSSNYHTWCYATENLLTYKGYDKCIADDVDNREKDAEKLKNSKAALALSVDPSLYIHIQKCTSAYEIWKKLKDLFDDKGLTRKSVC